MSTLSDHIAGLAVGHVVEAMRRGAFDDAIESAVLSAARSISDRRALSRNGFLLKMAIELIDNSRPRLSLADAKLMALDAYNEFRRDNRVKFGDEGWDWNGLGAREVARAYVIEYWEPA